MVRTVGWRSRPHAHRVRLGAGRARSSRELRVIGDGAHAARGVAPVQPRLRDLLVHAVDIAEGAVQIELALAGLVSGEYALEFEAPGARAAVVTRLEFAVTP